MPDRVKVSSALVALSVLLAPKVILPAKLLVTSLSVPPFKVMASLPTMTLYRSKVAPLAMMVPLPAAPLPLAPKPALLVIIKVPPLMVVVPV
ncbi:hypothetical protein POBR111598_10425 [Polynucleobacter brandtiae]